MKDLEALNRAGQSRLLANSRRDLKVTDIKTLIESSRLTASDELIDLISKVYSIGYEQGYRAHRTHTQNKRRLTV